MKLISIINKDGSFQIKSKVYLRWWQSNSVYSISLRMVLLTITALAVLLQSLQCHQPSLCNNHCSPKFWLPFSSRHTIKHNQMIKHSINCDQYAIQNKNMTQKRMADFITLLQNSQKYLLYWLTSIFLICLCRLAPYRVPSKQGKTKH